MKVTQSCMTLCNRMDYTVHGILQARILQWVAFLLSWRSSQPRSHTLPAYSLLAEPQEKPQNTGVGSLSLLQQIFPTQGLKPGIPHCRQILYQFCQREAQEYWRGWGAPFTAVNDSIYMAYFISK